MGIFFGSYSEDSEQNGMGYVEVEVEVDKTQENFRKKTNEIKEFIENFEKIKKNIFMLLMMMILQKNLIKEQNRTKEILFLEIIFLIGKKQKNFLALTDINTGSGLRMKTPARE